MPRCVPCSIMVVMAGYLVGSAMAAPSVQWVQQPINAAAITSDPSLTGFQTFDLQATFDGEPGAHELRITLSQGSIYNGSPDSNGPQAGFWGLIPSLEFDTFVSVPIDFNAAVSFAGSHATDASGSAISTPTLFSVAWFDSANTGAGIYTIARVTLSNEATGTWDLTLGQDGENVGTFNGVIPIPEPTTLTLLGLTGAGALLTRSKSIGRRVD